MSDLKSADWRLRCGKNGSLWEALKALAALFPIGLHLPFGARVPSPKSRSRLSCANENHRMDLWTIPFKHITLPLV